MHLLWLDLFFFIYNNIALTVYLWKTLGTRFFVCFSFSLFYWGIPTWKDGFGQVQKAWGGGLQRWQQQFQSQEEMDVSATGGLEFWRQGAVTCRERRICKVTELQKGWVDQNGPKLVWQGRRVLRWAGVWLDMIGFGIAVVWDETLV